MNFETVKKNLEYNGFAVSCFETVDEANEYLLGKINGKTISTGGSVTLAEMGILDKLAENNTVYVHVGGADPIESAHSDVFLSSVNGLAETGEIINIDGFCNRISSNVCGHEEEYFIVGKNKLAKTFDKALWRARNIAAPKNAQRLHKDTPCALKGDKCYNCNSPDRICRGLLVLWKKPRGNKYVEVVLINQDLGY